MSSVLSGNSPLSSHADSPGSPALPVEDEDVIMENHNGSPPATVSTTTERLNEMELAANLLVAPSATLSPASTTPIEGEEKADSEAPSILPASPVFKPPTLPEGLKRFCLRRKRLKLPTYQL